MVKTPGSASFFSHTSQQHGQAQVEPPSIAMASAIVGYVFGILTKLGLAPPIPTLSALDPSLSTLDNEIYNNQSFDWSKSGLALLNPVRVGYFMVKLHRHVSSYLDHGGEGRKNRW